MDPVSNSNYKGRCLLCFVDVYVYGNVTRSHNYAVTYRLLVSVSDKKNKTWRRCITHLTI
jgi:hypothetical protein